MGYAQPVIRTYIIMLENCCIRVCFIKPVLRMFFKINIYFFFSEGAFEAAEGHLLASGKRDSARLLAEMFIQWALPNQVYGLFSVRGTIPYVNFPLLFNSLCLILYQVICRMAIFLLPAPLSNISLQGFPRHFNLILIRRFLLAKRIKSS